MSRRSTSLVTTRSGAISLPIDTVTAVGLVAAIAFAGMIGGVLWAGLAVVIAAVVVNLLVRHEREMAMAHYQQETMAHHLLKDADPEELAELMIAGEVGQKNLYEFLEALKHNYGGESVDGDQRKPGADQMDAVSPGMTVTLAHDLGHWYAKIQLSGVTAKRYFPGGMAVWKGRGKTPHDAVNNAMRRCAQARQQVMIQEYAAKMVTETD